MQNLQQTIPKQKEGAKSDTWAQRRCRNREEAIAFFKLVKTRLLHVSAWEKICKGTGADFILTDHDGNIVERAAMEGDHFRIDIPGPGTIAGKGFDWVRIVKVEELENRDKDLEQLTIMVRPSNAPGKQEEEAAHFFKENASSTFIVSRTSQFIRAEVHGRNELPNLSANHFLDKLRNALVALGATIGFSRNQWKKLVKGLISPD